MVIGEVHVVNAQAWWAHLCVACVTVLLVCLCIVGMGGGPKMMNAGLPTQGEKTVLRLLCFIFVLSFGPVSLILTPHYRLLNSDSSCPTSSGAKCISSLGRGPLH